MSEEAKDDVRQVTVERLQRSHGRLIQVVSVFPVQGSATPEDKLKALIDLMHSRGSCAPKGLDIPQALGYCVGAMR